MFNTLSWHRRDNLTDLLTRESFSRKVEQNISKYGNTAIILICINNFNRINLNLGTEVGDEILKLTASRLHAKYSMQFHIARIGGATFILTPKNNEDIQDLGLLCVGLRTILENSFNLHTHGINLDTDVDIGVAYTLKENSVSEFIRWAEVAMYEARKTKQPFVVYSNEIDSIRFREMALDSNLRLALKRDQLQLVYLPKKDLRTKKIVSVEALLRWNHPIQGTLMPAEFLHVAEQSSLILEITNWVALEMVNQCLMWDQDDVHLQASINISNRGLNDGQLLSTVCEIVSKTDFNPTRLTLEVSEETMSRQQDSSKRLMEYLAKLGLKLSIDNFRNTSLTQNQLVELPIHEIKICRSLTQDLLTNITNVGKAIGLGHKLGYSVIAEGVEDRNTQKTLQELDCDGIQGFYLSKPVPATRITRTFLESIECISDI